MSAVFDDTRHHHDDVSPDRELVRLLGHLDDILDHLASAETQWHALLAPVAADYRSSARNIVHYWALRQIDMRAVQRRLAAFGLSSLGHSESHVQATIRLVRSAASAMLGNLGNPRRRPSPVAREADVCCVLDRLTYWDRPRPPAKRGSWSRCPHRRPPTPTSRAG